MRQSCKDLCNTVFVGHVCDEAMLPDSVFLFFKTSCMISYMPHNSSQV